MVVEAKLARNGQSRREVVGQVIDYVSALTALTVDELDDLVGGGVEGALRALAGAAEEQFDVLWQAVGSNLRAGLARYLIVVDEVPAALERIVRFLAERSNLDIGLVTLSRYRDADGRHVLVPRHLVRSKDEALVRTTAPERKLSAELAAVVGCYNATAPAGMEAVGRASGFRQIRPMVWPGGLHYEFLQYSDAIGVELHLETPACAPVAGVVEALAHGGDAPLPLEWSAKWQRGPGRLRCRFSTTRAPEEIASAMKEFMDWSCDAVTRALQLGG